MYSFIDTDRIGAWGWSYGGYATTMMLIRDHDKIVTCGAAVAPVTSWLYYGIRIIHPYSNFTSISMSIPVTHSP